MIESLHNKDGLCEAWIEWTLTDGFGNVRNSGKFIYIYNVWCHKHNGAISKFIKIIYDKTPSVEWVYFNRSKYNKRMRLYPKRRFERWLKKYSNG